MDNTINCKEANENLILLIQQHLILLQSGKFGTPTTEDLDFCGKLHLFLENEIYKK